MTNNDVFLLSYVTGSEILRNICRLELEFVPVKTFDHSLGDRDDVFHLVVLRAICPQDIEDVNVPFSWS